MQRLTRTHIAEVFESKKLPRFDRVDWISDEKVVCVFKDAQAATIALAGCLRGFEEGSDRPGPGLWRAVRGMLDFRQAAATDVPGPNFKKWHRAGRQVRDYRFWEAAKDIDRNILDSLEQKGTKRDAPTGEDAIAAAVYAEELGEAPRKKRRKNKGPVEEEEAPDLLQQMAQKDRELMALKEEVQPEDTPMEGAEGPGTEAPQPEAAEAEIKAPAAPAAPSIPAVDTGEGEAISAVCDVVPQERWEDSWFAQQAKTSGNRTKGDEPWGRHAKADELEAREDVRDDREGGARRDGRRRGAADRDWRHDLFNYATERERQARNNRGAWGHDDRGDWGGADVRDREAPRKRGRGDHWDRGQEWQARPDAAGGAAAAPSFKPADDEETRKRRKRMERFSKAAPAAAHGDAAPS